MLLLALAAIPLLIELVGVASSHYGYLIDEFYYLACSKRLACGYVDHPPLAPFLLAMTRQVLGESMLGIRLAPFLAASATVGLTVALVRELGGGRFAQILGGLSVACMPILLALASFFSMNAFESLIWSALVLVIVRIVRRGERRGWVIAGALAGLGVDNKHTFAIFVLALGIGLLCTRARRVLLDPWLWCGAAVAALLIVPNLAWQIGNGWPSLEFYEDEQTQATVFVPDYGHAGAIELWSGAFGLPRVICPQNTYWNWSSGRADTQVLIALGMNAEDLRQMFKEVVVAGMSECEFCMTWRRRMPILVARDPIAPLGSIWPRLKFYY